MQPAAPEGVCALLRHAPVATHDIRSPGHDFPNGSARDFAIVLVDDFHFHARNGFARRA